jgi:hypothetical protein
LYYHVARQQCTMRLIGYSARIKTTTSSRARLCDVDDGGRKRKNLKTL